MYEGRDYDSCGRGIRVDDNGRGIPVDIHPKTGKSTLETVLTVLNAGGKFGGGGYKVSSGLHGVGSSVVNALSNKMIAEVRKNGKVHHIEFEQGKTLGKGLEIIGETDGTGTSVTFYPDPTIFKETTTFDYGWVSNYARHQAYLTKGILIEVKDERTGRASRSTLRAGFELCATPKRGEGSGLG